MACRSHRITCRSQAANQQDVGVLLVGVEPHELRGMMRGTGGLASGKQRERRLMENAARGPSHMTALVVEPHLEPGAGPKDQPVQQFVAEAGKRSGLRPGAPAEHIEVDECPGRQCQPQRIAAELGVLAQWATHNRQRPAERSEWVVSLGEQQRCQPLSRRRDATAKQIGSKPQALCPRGASTAAPARSILGDPRRWMLNPTSHIRSSHALSHAQL